MRFVIAYNLKNDVKYKILYKAKAYLISWVNPLTLLPRAAKILWLETVSPLKSCLNCKKYVAYTSQVAKIELKIFNLLSAPTLWEDN